MWRFVNRNLMTGIFISPGFEVMVDVGTKTYLDTSPERPKKTFPDQKLCYQDNIDISKLIVTFPSARVFRNRCV